MELLLDQIMFKIKTRCKMPKKHGPMKKTKSTLNFWLNVGMTLELSTGAEKEKCSGNCQRFLEPRIQCNERDTTKRYKKDQRR